jgi:hypothetical protein
MRTAKSLCSVLVLVVLATCVMTAPAVTPVSRVDQLMLSGGGNGWCQGTRWDCPDPNFADACQKYGSWCYWCKATNVPFTDCINKNDTNYDCGITNYKTPWCGGRYWGTPDPKTGDCTGLCTKGPDTVCGRQYPNTFTGTTTPCPP